jgi:tetratricopeptide (TPR) repeat protein
MGQVKMYYEWDWAGAERAYQRANELNPNLAPNHYHYAWYLYLHGRIDEAIVEHERARDLDPLTPRNTAYLTDIYVAAGRYDDALATAKKAIEMTPRSGVAWQALGFVHSSSRRSVTRRIMGSRPGSAPNRRSPASRTIRATPPCSHGSSCRCRYSDRALRFHQTRVRHRFEP